jgi:hypothetical protein
VAALCRGLRFDGDITLKDVAMAFQLRDAYDWDEDLEASAKEVSAEDAVIYIFLWLCCMHALLLCCETGSTASCTACSCDGVCCACLLLQVSRPHAVTTWAVILTLWLVLGLMQLIL